MVLKWKPNNFPETGLAKVDIYKIDIFAIYGSGVKITGFTTDTEFNTNPATYCQSNHLS